MHKHVHVHQLTREDSEEEYTQNTQIRTSTHRQAHSLWQASVLVLGLHSEQVKQALAPYWTGDLAEGLQAHSHYSSFSPLGTLN